MRPLPLRALKIEQELCYETLLFNFTCCILHCSLLIVN